MDRQQMVGGFTIVELVVTIGVMSLFLTMFFQFYLANQSQQTAVLRQAAAHDLAKTNLRKVSSKAVPSALPACTTSNNLQAGGSTPSSITFTQETSIAPLPSSTSQTLEVLYPYGCAADSPAQIISTVTYGSETVRHAGYVQ